MALGRQMGRGKEAQVFAFGSRVAKLYGSGRRKEAAFREAAILAGLENTGLPAPVVWGVQRIARRWGLVMDRVSGASFAERMREDHLAISSLLEHMARLHLRIHAHEAVRLASLTTRLASNIRNAAQLEPTLKETLLRRLRGMDGGDRLCHGDFHPGNIMGEPGTAVVIDWLDATRGDPAADVCRTYLLVHRHSPEIATAYVDAYCRAAHITRRRVLRWLPFIAAARLAENVPDDVPWLLGLCLF